MLLSLSKARCWRWWGASLVSVKSAYRSHKQAYRCGVMEMPVDRYDIEEGGAQD